MRLAAAVLAVLALAASPGFAAEPRASLPDVEDEVMCVTCNVPLNIAESPQASRQRAFIRRLVDRGLTKEQIKARLVDEYGEDVLALPDTDGVGITAYAIPVVLGAIVLGSLVLLVPRWRRRPAAGMATGDPGGPAQATTDHTPALDDADLARLDEDLARYDR